MKRLILIVLCSLCINLAHAQQRHEIILDSLKHQLPLKKTAKDSLYTLQQITDRLYEVDLITLDREFEGYFTKFMELNDRLKLTDPAPYVLLQKAREYNKNKQYREQLAVTKKAVSLFDKQHKQISPLLIYIRVIYNNLGDQEGRLAFTSKSWNITWLMARLKTRLPVITVLAVITSQKPLITRLLTTT
jgi:hypothetical protein